MSLTEHQEHNVLPLLETELVARKVRNLSESKGALGLNHKR